MNMVIILPAVFWCSTFNNYPYNFITLFLLVWEERYVALILRRTTAYQIFVTIYVLSADGGGICGISRSRSL